MERTTLAATLAFTIMAVAAPLTLGAVQTPPSEDTQRKLEALVDQSIGQGEATPSYTVLVDIGGETVFEYSSGLANIEHAVEAGPDTVYQIGSITKSYTALAIAQLVEQGLINLDSPVEGYLPDYQGPGKKATVRQLLVHTSGIPNYTALPEARPMLTWVPTTRSDIVALFEDKELDFEPGSNFSYSNSGYYLLGLIIESVTEQDYYDYIQQHIFEPLDLKRTVSGRYEDIVSGRAQGYDPGPDGFVNAGPTPYLTPFAAGSLQATAGDLVRYRRGVFNDPAFASVLPALLKTGTFSGGETHRYAEGALSRSEHHGYEGWGHSGGISGFTAHHEYYPALDMTVVTMTNTASPPISAGELSEKLVTLILGEEPEAETPPEAGAVTNEALNPLVGTYVMSPFRITGDGLLKLLFIDDKLHLQLGGDESKGAMTLPLTPLDKRNLAVEGAFPIRIIAQDGNPVTELEILVAGEPMYATRVED